MTDVAVASKVCSTCGQLKSLTAYTNDKRKKDGKQSRCLECHGKYQKARREGKDREHYLALRKAEGIRLVETNKKWRIENAEAMKISHAKWLANRSPEQVEKDREAHRVSSAEYREANKELCNSRIEVWRKENPELSRHYSHVRRVRMYGNGEFEVIIRSEIGKRDNWICGLCDEGIDPALKFPEHMSQSLDHVIPLSKGGLHLKSNVQITHYICNVRKNAREDLPDGNNV